MLLLSNGTLFERMQQSSFAKWLIRCFMWRTN